MFKLPFRRKHPPAHTEPVELPAKVLKALDGVEIAPRQSGLLIIGLGEPFFYESIDEVVMSRFAEFTLSEQQLELAAETLRIQVMQDVKEVKKAMRKAKRGERSPWSNNQRWRRH